MASAPLADSSSSLTPTDSDCPCYCCSCHNCPHSRLHCHHCASKYHYSCDFLHPESNPDCYYSIHFQSVHHCFGTSPAQPLLGVHWRCHLSTCTVAYLPHDDSGTWLQCCSSPGGGGDGADAVALHSRNSPILLLTRDAVAAGDAVLLCPQSPDGNAVAVDERRKRRYYLTIFTFTLDLFLNVCTPIFKCAVLSTTLISCGTTHPLIPSLVSLSFFFNGRQQVQE